MKRYSDIQALQEKLRNSDNLIHLEPQELRYASTPIGEALYNHKFKNQEQDNLSIPEKKGVGRPRTNNPKIWSDQVKCNLCNKYFVRSHRSSHNQTIMHKRLKEINENLGRLLFEKVGNP